MFAAVADFGRLAEWDPFVKRVRLVQGERLAPDTLYRLHSIAGMQLHYRAVEVEAPRRVVYEGGTDRVTSRDTITIDREAIGSTVAIESVLTFAGWARLASPLIRILVWLGGRYLSLPAMQRRLERG